MATKQRIVQMLIKSTTLWTCKLRIRWTNNSNSMHSDTHEQAVKTQHWSVVAWLLQMTCTFNGRLSTCSQQYAPLFMDTDSMRSCSTQQDCLQLSKFVLIRLYFCTFSSCRLQYVIRPSNQLDCNPAYGTQNHGTDLVSALVSHLAELWCAS